MEIMTKNKEKAKEIANEMVELAHYSSLMTPDEQRNNIMNVADVACMKMAEWKDEQHNKKVKSWQLELVKKQILIGDLYEQIGKLVEELHKKD